MKEVFHICLNIVLSFFCSWGGSPQPPLFLGNIFIFRDIYIKTKINVTRKNTG